jgi:hypothetical protein
MLWYRDRQGAVTHEARRSGGDDVATTRSGVGCPLVERVPLASHDVAASLVDRRLGPEIAGAPMPGPTTDSLGERTTLYHAAGGPRLQHIQDALRGRVGCGAQDGVNVLSSHGQGVKSPAAMSAHFPDRLFHDGSSLWIEHDRWVRELSLLGPPKARDGW